jgi:hypothetical protein
MQVAVPASNPLARLGIDSGGTLTERNNDSRLALDRAVKRLACVYSLGIRGSDLPEGRRYAFAVQPRRSGLHALHASASLLRTDAMKHESLVRAAYFSPRSFPAASVHAALQPLEPASRDTWRAQLLLGFDVPDEEEDRTVDVGATLTTGTSVVHRFSRAVAAHGGNAATRKVSKYTLSEPFSRTRPRHSPGPSRSTWRSPRSRAMRRSSWARCSGGGLHRSSPLSDPASMPPPSSSC